MTTRRLSTLELLAAIKGGLIVSVQADPGAPMDDPHVIAAIAATVAQAGCVALRIDQPSHVRAVRRVTTLPIVAISKDYSFRPTPLITPSFEAAAALVEAGADIIALEVSARRRLAGDAVEKLMRQIHRDLKVPIMADIGTLEEGLQAASLGADLIATTLAGVSAQAVPDQGSPPDLHLVRLLVARLSTPIIAEGRYNTPALAQQALSAGAHAVAVGTAITSPAWITAQFVRALASIQQQPLP